MAQNMTADNSSLPSETQSLQLQCLGLIDVTVLTMNAISFLVNIFHLSVTTRLETLKGTQYRTIIINISLANMSNTLIVTVFNCSCDDFFCFYVRLTVYTVTVGNAKIPFTKILSLMKMQRLRSQKFPVPQYIPTLHVNLNNRKPTRVL